MPFVLAVDIGSTQLRCFAFNKQAKSIASRFSPVTVIHPEVGASEIDPEEIWNTFKTTVKETLVVGGLNPKDAVSLGVTCQRNSFLLWNRTSGQPLCNIITWQDRRSALCCDRLNGCLPLHLLHLFSSIAHFITRSNRFLLGSVAKFVPVHVAPRLYWALHNVPHAFELAEKEQLCFGTLDSWMLWKLTGGKVHATDYTNASSTLLFDPFYLCWSDLMLTLLGIPKSILPDVKDTSGDFGTTSKDVFGAEIPICCLVADQQSALFAQCCWDVGDMKASLGTGTFLSINTGSYVHASTSGIYPLVAWKIGPEVCYIAECHSPSTGSVVEWAKKFGLFEDVADTEKIARSVADSGGVSFVPAFDGMSVPYEDPTATAVMLGLNHKTQKEHMLRALLESFAFQITYLRSTMRKELCLPDKPIKVDGGVANNNFVLQLACNLMKETIQRPGNLDITVLGATFLAGLAVKFWDRDELRQFWTLKDSFSAIDNSTCVKEEIAYREWLRASERACNWYH